MCFLLARSPVVEESVGSWLSVTPRFVRRLVRRAGDDFRQRVCCSVRGHECSVGCFDFLPSCFDECLFLVTCRLFFRCEWRTGQRTLFEQFGVFLESGCFGVYWRGHCLCFTVSLYLGEIYFNFFFKQCKIENGAKKCRNRESRNE